ncbi:hypothetical protein F4811DRAFT_539274 [Daldinia bambusicola]|nr:hypothetical protein F4811DRAFT_539274 [Daldinia bambusicola]
MESADSSKNLLKRKLQRAKQGIKDRFKGLGSQESSRVQSPTPTERNQSATHLSPSSGAVRSASNEQVIPTRILYDSSTHGGGMLTEYSHDTALQIGHRNSGTSHIPQADLVTHARGNEANAKIATVSGSGNDPNVLLGPDQLWAEAYKRLEVDDPKLLDTYQQFLLSKGQSNPNHVQVASESHPSIP